MHSSTLQPAAPTDPDRPTGPPVWHRLLWGHHPRRTLLRGVFLALCCYGFFGFWMRPALTRGISMEPTVHDRSLHLLNLQAYRNRAPARGDIVAVQTYGNRVYYLKRILGLPGESLAFRDGQLLIDDRPQPEPYLEAPGDWTLPAVALGLEEYFVAGDNRRTALRSHLLGRVDRRDLAGTLWL